MEVLCKNCNREYQSDDEMVLDPITKKFVEKDSGLCPDCLIDLEDETI